MTTAQPQPLAGVVAYVVSCSVILVLFWPEAAPKFFTPLTTRVFPGCRDFVCGAAKFHDG